ncbi:PepSY-associated TM helix domain-containing protein [Pararobbsia silviterrae]|uniref:PepSY domain-containing protein n=1 Tax=Pararobbsia silviterrae TaxID=1792498 RepID=A0A494X9G5_9BURK|nr:PepSY-associated TM helix domain-containing protein [Pararobbsia silviterrae]RKP47110.1 PepSY domain-containing protein [Pararobbsia silviterrae]
MSIRSWAFVHRWTSLICTLFLFIICLTGLPLLFSDEISDWLTPHTYATVPAGTPPASLDRLVATSRAMYPHDIVATLFVDDDEPQVYVWMAPTWNDWDAVPTARHYIRFDARTGQMLEQSPPLGAKRLDFLSLMLRLHRDLFAGLPGELFLGLMGLLFVAAIVSGVVLYAPFMKKLDFGTVRADRSTRIKWLDLHNLLGIATAAWVFVVGATGVMNELSTPLFAIWQQTDVKAMLSRYQGASPPRADELVSVQHAYEVAQRAVPNMTITGIGYPTQKNGSPWHYLLWAKGSSTITSRLFSPILVDARTGQLTQVVEMPWYLRALEVSRPLHFGDYGGVPLKILWACFDAVTLVVLGSGLYLWFARRKAMAARIDALEQHEAPRARAAAAHPSTEAQS